MKKLNLLIAYIIIPTLLFTQISFEDDDGGFRTDNFEFFRPALVTLCKDVDCKDVTETKYQVDRGIKFKYVSKLKDGDVVIEFWEFNKEDEQKKFNYRVIDNKKVKCFFKVEAKDWNTKVIKRYSTSLINFSKNKGERRFASGSSITAGILLLPYKIRPQITIDDEVIANFDFSKDISLGLSAGIKHRVTHHRPYFINFLLNIGIGNITQTNFNTKGEIEITREVPALTIATGLVFDLKEVQIGAFIGWDRISANQRKNWMYQGRHWYSIGLGYSLFSVNASNSTGSTGKN